MVAFNVNIGVKDSIEIQLVFQLQSLKNQAQVSQTSTECSIRFKHKKSNVNSTLRFGNRLRCFSYSKNE